MASLEQQLRLLVPADRKVDLSTVPALYFTKFKTKLVVPSGFKNLSAFVKSLPHAFDVETTKSENDKITYYYVKQRLVGEPLVARAIPKATVAAAAPIVLSQHSTVRASEIKTQTSKLVASKSVATKVSLHVPLELNERGEVTVSLSQLTASLQSSRRRVPIGGLAAFICAKKTANLGKDCVSLISGEKMGTGTKAGSSILGFNATFNGITAPGDNAVFMNTTDPFCAVCIGVQGAGKSHTMNVILENCMLNTVSAENCTVVSSPQPMCGLVLHYDQSESNCCEAVGLNSPAAPLSLFPGLKVQRLVVLASPTYYLQRKAFYGDTCEVIPLLFDWDTLTATQLKKLMRLSDSDAQLYVSVILNKLREYQRKNKIPSFDGFLDEVMALCNVQGQNAPLQQVKKMDY